MLITRLRVLFQAGERWQRLRTATWVQNGRYKTLRNTYHQKLLRFWRSMRPNLRSRKNTPFQYYAVIYTATSNVDPYSFTTQETWGCWNIKPYVCHLVTSVQIRAPVTSRITDWLVNCSSHPDNPALTTLLGLSKRANQLTCAICIWTFKVRLPPNTASLLQLKSANFKMFYLWQTHYSKEMTNQAVVCELLKGCNMPWKTFLLRET